MTTQEPFIKIIYFLLLIILLGFLLYILFWNVPQNYSQLYTKQTGYQLASVLLITGLLGLWLDNTSLFQQQAFKLLFWTGVIILLLTFCFSITIDILTKIADFKK